MVYAGANLRDHQEVTGPEFLEELAKVGDKCICLCLMHVILQYRL